MHFFMTFYDEKRLVQKSTEIFQAKSKAEAIDHYHRNFSCYYNFVKFSLFRLVNKKPTKKAVEICSGKVMHESGRLQFPNRII